MTRRLGRPALVVALALGVVGILRLAGAAPEGEGLPTPPSPRALPVATVIVEAADGYATERRVTGLVEARRRSVLSFEGSGRLDAVLHGHPVNPCSTE